MILRHLLPVLVIQLIASGLAIAGVIPSSASLIVCALCIAYMLGIFSEAAAAAERARVKAVNETEAFIIWGTVALADDDFPDERRDELDAALSAAQSLLDIMDRQAPWYIKLRRSRTVLKVAP